MAGNSAYARFNAVFGTNGTGKSTLMGELIRTSHYKNALVLLESVDLNGNPFKGLPTVKLSEYRGGKVTIDSDTISFNTFLNTVNKHFRNGILVIDEAGLYPLMEKGDVHPALKHLLKQRRKYNVEVFLIFHGVSEIPVRLIKWCNNFILFHQTEEFKHKGMIPRIHELQEMKERIKTKYLAGDHHYCERFQLS